VIKTGPWFTIHGFSTAFPCSLVTTVAVFSVLPAAEKSVHIKGFTDIIRYFYPWYILGCLWLNGKKWATVTWVAIFLFDSNTTIVWKNMKAVKTHNAPKLMTHTCTNSKK
jgi:hypothetical protein